MLKLVTKHVPTLEINFLSFTLHFEQLQLFSVLDTLAIRFVHNSTSVISSPRELQTVLFIVYPNFVVPSFMMQNSLKLSCKLKSASHMYQMFLFSMGSTKHPLCTDIHVYIYIYIYLYINQVVSTLFNLYLFY